MKQNVLALNSGSSSIKFAVFALNGKKLGKEIISGKIAGQSGSDYLTVKRNSSQRKIKFEQTKSKKVWWERLENVLENYQIDYVGFRVVHGGNLGDCLKIDKSFFSKIKKFNALAPLHNPPAIELIKIVQKKWPKAELCACFDTGWYQDLKPDVYLYSIPKRFYSKHGIRKYGFHGLAHEAATNFAAQKLRKKIKSLSLVTVQIGSGVSATWLEKGKVRDTSMGFTPNEGVTMATRSGDLPADAVLAMEKIVGSREKLSETLNKDSGLKALAGSADLRDVLSDAGYKVPGHIRKSANPSQKKDAKLALEVYLYDIRRYIASYVGMSKKIDAIVFSGTASQNKKLREMILSGLSLPKKTKILFAPVTEEQNIAKKTLKCLKK